MPEATVPTQEAQDLKTPPAATEQQSTTEATNARPSAEPSPSPQPPGKGFLPLLESLTKVGAGLLVAAYVSGYLIVSIHDSTFGFTELSPFKPKILGAGVLFGVLTLMPVSIAHFTFSRPSTGEDSASKTASFLALVLAYYYACSLATTGLTLVLSSTPDAGPMLTLPARLTKLLAKFPGPHWAYNTAAIVVFGAIFLLTRSQTKLVAKRPVLLIAACLVVFSYNACRFLFSHKLYGSSWTELWFFFVGLQFLFVRKILRPVIREPQKWKTRDWTDLVGFLVLALFFFSRSIYPKVQASWGGGEPIPVVFYLTKDSPLKPGEAVPALLLDESETGFYFVETNKSHAVFMPRSQVSMLFFSDKPIPTPEPKPATRAPQPPASAPLAPPPSPPNQPKH
jgi:hypothetical protein